jgi:putative transposase
MNKVTLSPDAYYQFSQKLSASLLFSTHDDYRHFLFLYCRHIQPVARTFAYCLLPDSFYVLLQIRDEASLQRHTERVGESADELVQDCSGYLERKVSTFVTRYHNTMSVPLPEPEKSWHCEYLPTEGEVAHRLELLHLYPLYHETVEENGRWPFTSLHSLQSHRHTFLDRDAVYGWFGGREGFMRESREVYLEMS